MAERIFDLPETKGNFQVKGIVTGVEKDSFFRELTTKTQRQMRMLNFGLSYKENETLYLNLQGMEQDNVYFSKRVKKGEKPDVMRIPWLDRFKFNSEGYTLIGNNIGVKKKVDSTGRIVNDKKVLTDFDSCKEVSDNLKDGMSIFARGNLDYSSFIDNNGNKKLSIKLNPIQISLCADIDFKSENYNMQNDFNQVIIFMGIDKETDETGKQTGRFVVSAKIVTYKTIEDVEFIIANQALANRFKKNLKPYNAIKVSGHIETSTQTEIVESDDDWGEEDAIEKVKAPTKREFIITGAKGSSIERELYTEENVTSALAKIAQANKATDDFGDNDNDNADWGDILESENEDEAW